MTTSSHPPAGVSGKSNAYIRTLRQLVQEGSVNIVGAKGRKVELPCAVAGLLDEILMHMQAGEAVSIVPRRQDLTAQQAGNLLGVSRPFMVRLLEEGQLPFHMAGSRRRVYLKDLLVFKNCRDKERHEAIGRMARMEMKAMTYDKIVLPEGAEER